MLNKIKNMIKLLLTKPGDPSSESGRSLLRYQRAALTSIVMMAGRVVNILTGLLTVPITLAYLGEDLFGIWMVVTSVFGFLSFSDFGIGVGLRNTLIECLGKNDDVTPRKLIGNALFLLTGLAFLMAGIVFLIFPMLPWGDLIKCKNPASVPHILPAMQSVILMLAFGLPVSQLLNISSAYQRGYWGYLCYFIGRILGFLFVIWCVASKKPLWLLAGGYVGFPHFVMLIGWIVFFKLFPFLRPWPVKLEKELVTRLFGIGFFVLLHHLSYALINTSAIIIIANTISAASSIPYSITQKLLGVSNVITASLFLGLSVAVGEAWHRKDFGWVRKTVRRTEKLTFLIGVLPLFVLLFFGRSIILYWTKSPLSVPSFQLLLICVLLSCALMIGGIYANNLMAMNYVRFVALVKFTAGIIVFYSGYMAGKLTQSPSLIAAIQLVFGALAPMFFFYWKMNSLLRNK